MTVNPHACDRVLNRLKHWPLSRQNDSSMTIPSRSVQLMNYKINTLIERRDLNANGNAEILFNHLVSPFLCEVFNQNMADLQRQLSVTTDALKVSELTTKIEWFKKRPFSSSFDLLEAVLGLNSKKDVAKEKFFANLQRIFQIYRRHLVQPALPPLPHHVATALFQ
ncbi:MAG: hypothetical protein WC371_05155 [Parachlamydiales bacterium]|jgi:hypothetical protein